jgi:hypothetical protein
MDIVGAAITTLVGQTIMMIISLIKIKSFIKIQFPIRIWVKTLIVSLIFIFIIWLLKKIIFLNVWLETTVVIIVSGICYIGLLFLFKIIKINELKEFYKRII